MILLEGEGASPTGDHPFLDRFNLDTLKSERIFQSSPDVYEVVDAVLAALRKGGYRAVTIDGIARRVGRARSSV